jgi:Domain of unknown function (DUF4439)
VECTRRDLFPLVLLAAVPLAAGCSENGADRADGQIRQRVAAQADSLAGLYGAAASGVVADPRFAGFKGHHLAHRALLLSGASNPATANPAVPAADLSAAPSSGPAQSGSQPPGSPPSSPQQPTAANLASDERAASATIATGSDLTGASGRLAALLVDVAACRAVHCAALDAADAQAQPPITATAPDIAAAAAGDLAAAQAILSAEHAAVYAYGALTPHLRGAQRDQAHGMYELHRQLRDDLEADIAAHGATPATMVAAYAFPQQPVDPASAAALAGYVETRMAAVCANAAAVATAAGRPYAAWAVISASLRAYAWGRAPAAFPATFSV